MVETGEEAIKVVQNELKEGRRVAVGFFDAVLDKGMEGTETIRKVKGIHEEMLCAVVTTHADHSIKNIVEIFTSPEEWIYYNKPFTEGELEQCAYTLVDLWNRRKREKDYIRLIVKKNNLLNQSR